MTVGTAWLHNSAEFDRGRLSADALPQRVLGGTGAVCVALVCAWSICVNLGTGRAGTGDADRADRLPFAAAPSDRLAVVRLPERSAPNIDMAAFDSRFSAAFPTGVFSWTDPIASGEWSAAPLPQPVPVVTQDLPPRSGRRLAESTRSMAPRWRQHGNPPGREAELPAQNVADATANKPTFLERIFGTAPRSIFAKLFGLPPSGVALAYAAPEAGVAGDGESLTTGLYDRQTAVYDISAHAVYMPNGTVLEAHSGLGSRLDDPRYVAERDRGPTPPDVYDLKLREQPFHGVQALRLIPVNEKKVFGRSGLLAHTYMLGPNGQSNGCVSIKDYDAFLQAYENHEITRLAVVSHLD